MNILLDTHALIWFIKGDDSLSDKAKEIITNPTNQISASLVSFYEMAIKLKIKKLDLKDGLAPFIEKVRAEKIGITPINEIHILAYDAIPLVENHRDPFDRLIIATASIEKASIITIDKQFDQYDKLVSIIW
ncbi:MAG: type II toxin-antitoxin system VapC family toxin [Cyclobacteriaceae bacterium]